MIEYATTDDGVRLAMRRVGDGPHVVVVPSMSWIVEDLAPLHENPSRSVVYYDIRGQGYSDSVPDDKIGFERDVADLDCVRTALDCERISLLGWSYHGALSARYAFAHRERVERMVLIGPVAPRAAPHWRKYLDNFSKRLDVKALTALEQHRREGLRTSDPVAWCRAHTELILKVYVADAAALPRMKSCPCVQPNIDPEVVNQQMLRVIEGMGDYDWRAEMQDFDVPTLILHGDRDPVPLEGSHDWIETLAAATLEIIDGSGHLPWIETPDRFFPPVETFLNAHE